MLYSLKLMVFVSALFLVSSVLVLVLILVNVVILLGDKLSVITVRNKFIDNLNKNTYLNVFYIYLVLFLLSFNTFPLFVFGVLTFVFITYIQGHSWSLIMEEKLTQTPLSLRKVSLERLLSENCVITHFTLHRYLYDLFVSELLQFRELISDSVEDIKIAFYLSEPSLQMSTYQKDLYNIQRKFFKFKKVSYPEDTTSTKSDEEILHLYSLLKKARDPKQTFNSVRRLPWKFTYNYESNLFFKLVVSNVAVIYNFFKTTLVAVLLMVIYFLYTIFFFKIQFLKQLSVWFVIGMIYFWLMSGFNFFLKRYQYGKFTSQIQRFWKRTNTYFWLIEGFLILLFFYYYLNSSQEPLYMYDYSAINQEYLVSLHTMGTNIILLSLVIYFMYFTLLRINSNSWTQLNLYLVLISSFIFFSFFIETYQFYYVVSTFNERLWIFNEEENLWSIDIDNPILRAKHQYLLVCLIAKYWHFLFIFLSWVFFLIKSFERKKITYVLFGANLQNMLILYVLNFACYLQWFKWIYRRFFDLPYTWFFINVDNKFFFRLFSEIKLVAFSLLNFNQNNLTFQNIIYKSTLLWNVDSLCMWKFL